MNDKQESLLSVIIVVSETKDNESLSKIMFQQLKLNLVNHDVDDVLGGAVAAAAVVVYCDREDGN